MLEVEASKKFCLRSFDPSIATIQVALKSIECRWLSSESVCTVTGVQRSGGANEVGFVITWHGC